MTATRLELLNRSARRTARVLIDTAVTAVTGSLRTESRHVELHPSNLAALQLAMEWLEHYIAAPHAELGRTGDVCPFVKPALKKDKVSITVYDGMLRSNLDALRRVLIAESRQLLKRAARETDDRDRELTSSVLLFPGLTGTDGAAIADAFRQCQGIVNERGAMVAVFFPDNPKPGVYNQKLPLYRSPFPIAAIRPMAIHDILFVGSSREAFAEYYRRFADHYRTGKVPRKTGFNQRFADACARFGLDEGTAPPTPVGDRP